MHDFSYDFGTAIVVRAGRDTTKSVLLLPQFTTKVWYFTTKYVPGNLVHFIYVPDVPVIWYKSGTKTSSTLDGR